jgi:hypothetical protein
MGDVLMFPTRKNHMENKSEDALIAVCKIWSNLKDIRDFAAKLSDNPAVDKQTRNKLKVLLLSFDIILDDELEVIFDSLK